MMVVDLSLVISAQLYGCLSWLWSSIEEYLYKENIGVLGEMLSKNFQNPCYFFSYNLVITHPN